VAATATAVTAQPHQREEGRQQSELDDRGVERGEDEKRAGDGQRRHGRGAEHVRHEVPVDGDEHRRRDEQRQERLEHRDEDRDQVSLPEQHAEHGRVLQQADRDQRDEERHGRDHVRDGVQLRSVARLAGGLAGAAGARGFEQATGALDPLPVFPVNHLQSSLSRAARHLTHGCRVHRGDDSSGGTGNRYGDRRAAPPAVSSIDA
jgi:hypothetical protein